MKASHITLAMIFAMAAAFLLKAPPFSVRKEVIKPEPPATSITALVKSEENRKRKFERKRQLRTIIKEPCDSIRHRLFSEFCDSLEPEEFPGAFDALTEQLGLHYSEDYDDMLAFWTRADPKAAWEKIRPMFDYAAPTRWTDSWEAQLIAPAEPNRLPTEGFWPRADLFAAFGMNIGLASISEAERKDLSAQFLTLYEARFGARFKLPQKRSILDENMAVEAARIRRIRLAETNSLEDLATNAVGENDFTAYLFALRRLVESDPTQARHSLDLLAETHRDLRPPADDLDLETLRPARYLDAVGHIELLRAWASSAPDEAWDWITEQGAAKKLILATPIFPLLGKEQRDELEALALELDPEGYDEFGALMKEAGADNPSGALSHALEAAGADSFSDVALMLGMDLKDAENSEQLLQAIEATPAEMIDGDAAQLMEALGNWNIEATARFGVDWLMSTDTYSREATMKVWRGEADPVDGLVPDRTFGCLRCWALTQPDRMRSWIQTQSDPEIRDALQWLLDHPNGK